MKPVSCARVLVNPFQSSMCFKLKNYLRLIRQKHIWKRDTYTQYNLETMHCSRSTKLVTSGLLALSISAYLPLIKSTRLASTVASELFHHFGWNVRTWRSVLYSLDDICRSFICFCYFIGRRRVSYKKSIQFCLIFACEFLTGHVLFTLAHAQWCLSAKNTASVTLEATVVAERGTGWCRLARYAGNKTSPNRAKFGRQG